MTVRTEEMEQAIASLANEKESLEEFKDQSDRREKEYHVRLIELERENKELQAKLEVGKALVWV